MQKLLIFFSKNISIYAIFNDQSFNGTFTNDVVSFEQRGQDNPYFPIVYGENAIGYVHCSTREEGYSD